MADNAFTGTAAACINCMTQIQAWVSHNDGTDWFQVPNVTQIAKTANTTNAQAIKLGGVAVAVCSANSKSWQYDVDVWDCSTHPIHNYMIDQDVFYSRFINGTDLAASAQEVSEVQYDDQGWVLNDQSNQPQKTTLRLNATKAPRRINYAEVGGAPRETAVNNAAALTGIPYTS